MTDDEVFAELARRLRSDQGVDVEYVDGAFVLHRWDGEPVDPPLHLHVAPEAAGRAARIDAETRDTLWPGTPLEHAGLNLLLVHLDEEIRTRCLPVRRHVVVGPHLFSDETPPPPPAEPGTYAWAPLSGTRYPAPFEPGGRGDPRVVAQVRALQAWLDVELAHGRGELADATLQAVQDQAGDVIGSSVTGALSEHLRTSGADEATLRAAVHDDARAYELLAAFLDHDGGAR